jgi:hypothetical protein
VSPERELHELSTDPWRPTVSFLVIVTLAGRAVCVATCPDGGRFGGGLLAQKGLGRLLHRGGTGRQTAAMHSEMG